MKTSNFDIHKSINKINRQAKCNDPKKIFYMKKQQLRNLTFLLVWIFIKVSKSGEEAPIESFQHGCALTLCFFLKDTAVKARKKRASCDEAGEE